MSLARYLSKLGAMLGSDGKVPQGALAANVVGNGPAFSAYQVTQQTISTNATQTKIRFDTEEFDTANCYDKDTNYRFQPNVAGYYQINARVALQNPTNNTGGFATIFKNGLSIKEGSSGLAIGGQMWAYSNVSALIYLNGSSDYVETYFYMAGFTGAQLVATGISTTYFQGYLVKAA